MTAVPCTKCLEARRKLLAARTAREAAAALAEAIRINAGKVVQVEQQKDSGHAQS